MYSSPGGFAGSMYKGSGLGNNPTFSGNLSGIGDPTASTVIARRLILLLGGTAALSSRFLSSVNGNIILLNSAENSFGLLQFGGVTSSFAAIKLNGANLQIRLADDSAYTSLFAFQFISTGAAGTTAAGQVGYGGSVATTVGAAGAASALPATPVGYIIINVAGTQMKLPYYNT